MKSRRIEKEGFEIVPDVLSSETVDELIASIERVLKERPDQARHALRHLVQAVPVIGQVAKSDAVQSIVNDVLGQGAVVVRSLFFDKTPDANWKVAWHQDLTIAVRENIETEGFSTWSMKDGAWHVQPPTVVLGQMLTVRVHLDDSDASNGPLKVIPGSHLSGRLSAQQIADWREDVQEQICCVPRGGVLLMRPLILHASSAAAKPGHRRVVHLEFSAQSLPGGLQWFE